jgi:5-methylcytosine-specific restriction endonuclease McrA
MGSRFTRLPMLGARIPTLDTQRVPESATRPGTSRARRQTGLGKPYDRRAWRDRIQPEQLRREPLCHECLAQGKVTAATDVDHVDGDPFNNVPANLRSLCRGCHARKTIKHDGGFGRPVDRRRA